MRISGFFAAGALLANFFVEAAPMTGSSATKIVKRNDLGHDVIDFEYVASAVRDINARFANQNTKTLQRRDDTDFIDQLMVELHNHNLLDEFINQLTDTPRLKQAVENGVLSAISQGKAKANVLLSSLRKSGQMSNFIDSVLNDPDLNDELYTSAREILSRAEQSDEISKREALDDSEQFLKALYYEPGKRDMYYDDLILHKYGMNKRDLVSTIASIVSQIYDSGFVKSIIQSIIGNQSLISYAINLFQRVFSSINWSSLFSSIKNSGIIKTLFASVVSLLTSLFSGSSLSSLFGELFGGSSNSTHKSFLATLLGIGINIGSDLFKSLTNSTSGGATSGTGSTSGTGLLSGLLSTFLNGTSSTKPSATATPTSGSTSTGGFLSGLLSNLFGGLSSSQTASGSTGSSAGGLTTSSGTPSGSSSSGGLLSTIFNNIFGSGSSTGSSGSSTGSSGSSTVTSGSSTGNSGSILGTSGSTSSGSGSSSGSNSASTGSITLGSLFDNLFGGNNSGSGSSGTATKTSSAVLPIASSSVFDSKKACCCSPEKIKQRALRRALKRKVKRSVKRTLRADTLQLPEEMLSFFYIK